MGNHLLSIVVLAIPFAVGGYVVWLLENNEARAAAVVAVGTLILASVTAFKVMEEVQKERRDRLTRVLGEVRAWAEEAAKAAISRQTRKPHELWETRLKYKYSLATSPYITKVVEPFNNLTPCLENTIKYLKQAIDTTTKAIEGSLESSEKLVEGEEDLRKSIEKLLQEIAATKY